MDHLTFLLSESVEGARVRTSGILQESIPDFSNIALFGAGTMGLNTLVRLRSVNITPRAFIDDTPEKQGSFIEGIPVYSRFEAASVLGADITVIVTILNPKLPYPKAAKLLADANLTGVSVMLLCWAFPALFCDILNTAPPFVMLEHREDIKRVRKIWADDVSKISFDQQLLWRLTLDFTYLPVAHLDDIYFPSDLDLQLAHGVNFIDAGAYDGDSAMQFMQHVKEDFGQIVAIEPDPISFAKLEKSLAPYIDQRQARCFNMGLGGEVATLRFNATGDMSASLDDDGNFLVQINPLQFFLPETKPLYIKFDIEGAEWPTLTASRDIIVNRDPKLAISIYHDPRDLWRIPLLIHEYLPDKKLYLRAHGVDGTDVVLYAL